MPVNTKPQNLWMWSISPDRKLIFDVYDRLGEVPEAPGVVALIRTGRPDKRPLEFVAAGNMRVVAGELLEGATAEGIRIDEFHAWPEPDVGENRHVVALQCNARRVQLFPEAQD